MTGFPWIKILASVFVLDNLWSQATALDLPIVNLGYVRQQATEYNEALSLFNFSNVRYGQSPVGDLRWAHPLPPKFEPKVQRGEVERICFQSQPSWLITLLGPWTKAYLFNQTESFYKKFPTSPAIPPIPANLTEFFPPLSFAESEDCLFLDVYVPKKTFDQRKNPTKKKSPIFLWIHAGGFYLGHKKSNTDFKGLLAKSQEESKEPVIVVSINYRLGAFGFLGGPSLKASGGVSNVGLQDQRLAFEWVQKYVHLFGGDPQRVTVAGVSAGGSSIIHHITARGGRGKPPPFRQAVIQSGGGNPSINSNHHETTFHRFLELLKVKTFQQAKKVSSIDLRNANYLATFILNWGELSFGVEPDGDYVPETPAKLLKEGRFHRGIRLLVGQTAAEGFTFTSPWIKDEKSTLDALSDFAPTLPKTLITYLTTTIYPPTFNNPRLPYRSYLERATLLIGELRNQCNSAFLARAVAGKNIYEYVFNVPPAFHGDDIQYSFFNAANPSPSVNAELASTFQEYFLNFVRKGNPNEDGLPRFEVYETKSQNWTLNVDVKQRGGLGRVGNSETNERCFKWQASL